MSVTVSLELRSTLSRAADQGPHSSGAGARPGLRSALTQGHCLHPGHPPSRVGPAPGDGSPGRGGGGGRLQGAAAREGLEEEEEGQPQEISVQGSWGSGFENSW